MTTPCPHCSTPYDLTNRMSGDRVYCGACSGWFLLTFVPGGARAVACDPPATWPKQKGK